MTHTRKNKGTCSRSTTVDIRDGIVHEVTLEGGCNGNLKGVCALLVGRPADEAARLLRGTTCDTKPTSCPDQIALCLQEALALAPE